MIAIGLSLCYLANVWNIGAEGQFLIGAVAGSWLAVKTQVFYLRYHGYSKFFPLWALARYRNLRSTNSRVVGVGM